MGGSLEYDEIKKIMAIFNIGGYKKFVETGTFVGKTVSQLSNHFEKLFSIEISKKLYLYNVDKWREMKNINFINGDSSIKLKEVITEEKTIFFLDGHYSGHNGTGEDMLGEDKLKDVIYRDIKGEWKKNRVVVITEKGKKDVPLYEEIKVIDENCKAECLIIIDDVRLFGKKFKHGDWSEISSEKIFKCFIKKKIIKHKISEDKLYILI